MEAKKTALATQIETEIQTYLSGTVSVADNYSYSQAALVRRIAIFENHIYPTGKFDGQGNYKFWYDLATPRIMAEVKNIDLDEKDIEVHSDRKNDELAVIIVNLSLVEWMRKTGQAEELNDAVEEGSAHGNVVWKKVKGQYERWDYRNFYVINQTAKTLEDSPVIERHEYSQSDLRDYSGTWKNVKEAIDGCAQDAYGATIEATKKTTTVPYYEIYERNGEVCLKDLKEERGEPVLEGDEDIFVLAKVIACGVKSSMGGVDIRYIMYADTLAGEMCDIYKEYHRGIYKGRWFREGIIEVLFDLQVRANQIGNQISQGLEWASKTIFQSKDKLLVQNMMTDLANGDVIRADGISQITVRMEGFDQLIADWNRIIAHADQATNANAVVMGDRLPIGTSFRMAALLNQNAMKTFDFIRQKFALPLTAIFEQWVIPDLVKSLKAQDVLRLTGDPDMLDRLCQLVVDDWYLRNLIFIGPHTPDDATAIKNEKMRELKQHQSLLMSGISQAFNDFAPQVSLIIDGENSKLPEELKTLTDFIQLEQDPVRRQAMIELAMKKKGIDVASLPKSPPEMAAQPNMQQQRPQPQPPQQEQQQQQSAPPQGQPKHAVMKV